MLGIREQILHFSKFSIYCFLKILLKMLGIRDHQYTKTIFWIYTVSTQTSNYGIFTKKIVFNFRKK